MKYVFVVHSHTLFLTSLGVIDYLALKHEDVILLHTRNYRTSIVPEGAKTIYCDVEFEVCQKMLSPENRKNLHRQVRSFDAKVEEWIGECFELFVPHLWAPFFKLLQTNRKCRKVSLVQEGAYTIKAYFHNHWALYQKLRHRLGSFLKYGTTRFYGNGWYTDGELRHQKEIEAYAIFPEFFKYLECKIHIVKWPEIRLDLQKPDKGPVFIFDGFVKHGLCSGDFYLQTCRKMIEENAYGMSYLKFHPAQREDERKAIITMFEKTERPYFILDDKIPFELIILSCEKLTVVGLGSSLLYFAKAQGHTVRCYDYWLLDDSKYLEYHNHGVPVFNDYFQESGGLPFNNLKIES